MLTPRTASDMLGVSPADAPAGAEASKATENALVALHERTVDVLRGYVKMVEKAEPEFRPVAQRFHDIHDRHAAALAGKLGAMGVAVDEGGSLMGTVNETVVSLRALVDEIDEDVVGNIRSGEEHVLEAFADVLRCDLPPGHASDIANMRDELVRLLDGLPHQD